MSEKERKIVPVSTVVKYIKSVLDGNRVFHGVMMEGEISNYRVPYTGHWYFSLKDEHASMQCVMFASSNRSVKFKPKVGDKVIVRGDVTVYESEGKLQMIVSSMRMSGVGDLYLQLEQLKNKLSKEGLFDQKYKKPLPMYPMSIGLVTGNQTAGRADTLTTLRNRWPVAEVHEYVAPMQGNTAPPKIIEQLKKADQNHHDVILLVRGGGSYEELWCFNDEALARFIFSMKTPVVTGVGHDIDTTLVDYVADFRSITPTAAVKDSTPDIHEVLATVHQYQSRIENVVTHRLEKERMNLTHIQNSPYLQSPQRITNEKSMHIDYLRERLLKTTNRLQNERAKYQSLTNILTNQIHQSSKVLESRLMNYQNRILLASQKNIHDEQIRLQQYNQKLSVSTKNTENTRRTELEKQMRLLDAYSPLKILDRGYAIAMKQDHVLSDIDDINVNDEMSIRLSNGTITTIVKEKK